MSPAWREVVGSWEAQRILNDPLAGRPEESVQRLLTLHPRSVVRIVGMFELMRRRTTPMDPILRNAATTAAPTVRIFSGDATDRSPS